MYLQKGKNIGKSTIRKAVIRAIESHNSYYPRKKITLEDHELESVVTELVNLNTALGKKNDVYCICDKQPRNLDSGKHYFSIYYVKNGQNHRLWLYDFGLIVGGHRQDRDMHLPRYGFSSGAIGMSRILDACDGVFSFLKRIGGHYAQIDCKN